jgi:hypothetical protein
MYLGLQKISDRFFGKKLLDLLSVHSYSIATRARYVAIINI